MGRGTKYLPQVIEAQGWCSDIYDNLKNIIGRSRVEHVEKLRFAQFWRWLWKFPNCKLIFTFLYLVFWHLTNHLISYKLRLVSLPDATTCERHSEYTFIEGKLTSGKLAEHGRGDGRVRRDGETGRGEGEKYGVRVRPALSSAAESGSQVPIWPCSAPQRGEPLRETPCSRWQSYALQRWEIAH